jgi:antirestriction protein ArdC
MYFFKPEYINQKFLELLKTHGKDWKKPWINKVGGAPVNAVTGKRYTGMNPFLLMGSWNSYGMYWATMKQWNKIGCRVRDEESRRGTAIIFGTSQTRTVKDGDDEKQVTYPVCKTYLVYSSYQVEGWTMPEPKQTLYNTQGSQLVLDLVTACKVGLRHGSNKAYYSPTGDEITMPDPEQFMEAVGYDGTLLHELGHATGHEKRGLRQVPWAEFGTPAYAQEELVAEMFSLYMGVTLGIETEMRPDHAQYINGWMDALTSKQKKDQWAFYQACKKAERAASWVLTQAGLSFDIEPSGEMEEAEA